MQEMNLEEENLRLHKLAYQVSEASISTSCKAWPNATNKSTNKVQLSCSANVRRIWPLVSMTNLCWAMFGVVRKLFDEDQSISRTFSCSANVVALAGVISRGAHGGGAPLVKISTHVGRAQPPLKILHWLGFSEFIGLASKVL